MKRAANAAAYAAGGDGGHGLASAAMRHITLR
jgi:hypothetical protein